MWDNTWDMWVWVFFTSLGLFCSFLWDWATVGYEGSENPKTPLSERSEKFLPIMGSKQYEKPPTSAERLARMRARRGGCEVSGVRVPR